MATVQEVIRALEVTIADVSHSEAGEDPNVRFIADLKCNLSPYFNACGLIEASPVLASSTQSLQNLVDGMTANGSDSKFQDLIGRFSDLSKDQSQTAKSISTAMHDVKRIAESATEAINSMIDDIETDLAEGLTNSSRNASLISTSLQAVEKIETLADRADDLLYSNASLLDDAVKRFASVESNGPHRMVDDILRVLPQRAAAEHRFEIARSSVNQIFSIMPHNQRRFDLVNQTELTDLAAMHALMIASSIKSGYTPVSTAMHSSMASLARGPTADSQSAESVSAESSKLLTPATEISQHFNDPGYHNSPFFNVTLTFLFSHLVNGPNRGVDFQGLGQAPTLLPFLEELRSEAKFSESKASQTLDGCVVGMLAILAEAGNYIGRSTEPDSSDIPLEKIEDWRLRMERSLHVAAQFATALATIPGLSINTPEFSTSPGLPSLPNNPVDPYSFLTLNQYRVHTDHGSVQNSLKLHERARQLRTETRTHLRGLTATFDGFTSSPTTTEGISRLMASSLVLSAFIRRQVVQFRALVHTVHALIETWLCCKTSAPGEKTRGQIPDGPFMKEMMFVSAYIVRSLLDLLRDISTSCINADQTYKEDVSNDKVSNGTAPAKSGIRRELAESLAEEAMQPYLDSLQQRLDGIERVFDVLREYGVALDERTLDAVNAGAQDAYNENSKGLCPEFFPTADEILGEL